ncbi:E3 ubiquitin-protein ligase RNF8-like isoform X2 [Plodia interpunctella]|uniref:E3 ubiquitin-protein ligase RNF8-like isoform X2 n=1 Tax=Plodia interpunctella TaxID=58824 RepID=UPI00236871D3|nr:E3 ubiquitin-protein ligase RNF8-like isoform X2 [Plodia interpunctella]
MAESVPLLISCKTLKPEFEKLSRIPLISSEFTIGRGLKNSIVIPFLAISRNHCAIKKNENNDWIIEDYSSFGISVNGEKLGKDKSRTLYNEDCIALDLSEEFVYKLVLEPEEEGPRKKRKIEIIETSNDFLDNVKIKFEESQNYEIKHIEEKIQNAKQMQTTSMILKRQLQLDMQRKIQQLESKYAAQIENLQGEKNEVEKQKALHVAERDAQLTTIRQEMEGKIAELMEQIEKHNEAESELLKENNTLKEKLLKEREEFLSELNRKNSSKEEMLEKLEAKIREQEEIRSKEKKELEEMLRKETEQLRFAKEKELRELEEQKRQRESELEQELEKIRKNFEEKVQQTEQEKMRAEQQLNEQVEQMKKLNEEEKSKMEQLVLERAEIEKQLAESQAKSEKTLEELKSRVTERETELAALAAERIEKQVEQSSGVINSLQEQLEKVKKQLESVESEKNTLLENMSLPEVKMGEGPSKQSTLAEVGEVLESELQCSICAELFITATTLNCSHTFCKYCITMWKKKKKDCPICRCPIQSECKSIVIDSFIEKMVQNLTEELKKKRQDLLKNREEEIIAMERPVTKTRTSNSSRRRRRRTNTTTFQTTTRTSTAGSIASSPPIQVVDLTTMTSPRIAPRGPPPRPPVIMLPATLVRHRLPQPSGAGGGSPVYLVPITAATAAATAAAHAATGPPDALSDNSN